MHVPYWHGRGYLYGLMQISVDCTTSKGESFGIASQLPVRPNVVDRLGHLNYLVSSRGFLDSPHVPNASVRRMTLRVAHIRTT